MKILLVSVLILLLIAAAGLLLLARKSEAAPTLGLQSDTGQLLPCRYNTQCVNSQSSDESHIEPFHGLYWDSLPSTVVALGGQIEHQTDHYIWATFRSRWLGFVDDVEFVFLPEQGIIDVRSSSRVGRSDFGVNRQRVESIRAAVHQSEL
ncbi:MAG: DUF1499 domain-containing protein [Gammaproteobacteria bacterium]|nr:DUF1499 domain-containing protein [Gammaproteobacteria bacterium]